MTIFLPGRLPSLNEVIGKNRKNRYAGASLKKRTDRALTLLIKASGMEPLGDGPYDVRCEWVEPNRRRDPDNIYSAVKFVLDAMQTAGILERDGWQQIADIHHRRRIGEDVGVYVTFVKHEGDG